MSKKRKKKKKPTMFELGEFDEEQERMEFEHPEAAAYIEKLLSPYQSGMVCDSLRIFFWHGYMMSFRQQLTQEIDNTNN